MWTLQDAKNKFSAVVDAALTGQPQEVTRRGKPAVVVLSSAEFHRLVNAAAKERGSFADHLLSFPQSEPLPEVERAQATPRDLEF